MRRDIHSKCETRYREYKIQKIQDIDKIQDTRGPSRRSTHYINVLFDLYLKDKVKSDIICGFLKKYCIMDNHLVSTLLGPEKLLMLTEAHV